MGELPAEPGQAGDPESVAELAAVLRADAADVATLVRVLTATLGDTLPGGMVEVERDRTLGDRLAGRDGTPVAVTVTGPDRVLRLRHGRHRSDPVRAEVHRVVRGVVISRREVGLDEWVRALAELLTQLAARDAAARDVLGRWLGG